MMHSSVVGSNAAAATRNAVVHCGTSLARRRKWRLNSDGSLVQQLCTRLTQDLDFKLEDACLDALQKDVPLVPRIAAALALSETPTLAATPRQTAQIVAAQGRRLAQRTTRAAASDA
jgi:hypothetical protein